MNTSDIFNVKEIISSENQTVSLPMPGNDGDDGLQFIFVPLGVLIGIMALSALVYLMARSRRKLFKIYKLVHIQRSPQNDPWDDEDDPTECLLSGELQIDNVYQSVSSTGRKELYT